MGTLVPVAQDRVPLPFKPQFHLQMAFASALILILDIVGCTLTHIQGPNVGTFVIAIVIVLAAVQFIPIYWHSKGKMDLRDASLTIPWAVLLWALLPFPVDIAGRLGMGINLQDMRFARWDAWLGVNVPGIMSWASHHWLGVLATKSYFLLAPLMVISFLLPALTGKVKQAQQFLQANLVAFAVGLPFFALLPAIGPWYGYHLVGSPSQIACQSDFLAIRQAGLYVHHPSALICFPSFHVMWALLCVQALWVFRLCRIPVVVLSALIVFSTMTTGWHYFADVLGGIAMAVVAAAIAAGLNRWPRHSHCDESCP